LQLSAYLSHIDEHATCFNSTPLTNLFSCLCCVLTVTVSVLCSGVVYRTSAVVLT